MNIGKNIRARRKNLKMTLEKLALEIGSDTGNLSRIERGQQSVTTEKIAAIAKALNCQPIDLLMPQENSALSLPIGYLRIPLLNTQQLLNWDKLKEYIDQLDIEEWLITDSQISASSFAFTIGDSSMNPDFKNGDKIILDPTLTPEAGDFVLATDGVKNVFFRKYRVRGVVGNIDTFELYPLNQDFETFYSIQMEHLRVLGVMVEYRQYCRKNR